MAALAIMVFTDLDPANPLVTKMAALTVWMAIWWLTEAVHLAVTAFIPIVFMPLLGIADPKVVAFQYMDQIIFLFIGGFLISFAIERWGLHERIALRILMMVGTRADRILMGVMAASYLISMWISNTATVMMLISAVLAIIVMTDQSEKVNERDKSGFAKAILIGLAYAASIGGMATLVGTPPNMVFLRAYNESYPEAPPITFAKWFSIGFPVSIILLLLCFFILRMMFLRRGQTTGLDSGYFKEGYRRLGAMSHEQKVVLTVFIGTALLWFTRADLDLGFVLIPGWSNLFPKPDYILDSTVAVTMAMILFLFPSKNEKGSFLLRWKDAAKLPFDIILLFGSGFALAKGFEISGLSGWLAGQMKFLNGMSPMIIVISVIVLVCIISEFASNVASIQLALPILIAFQNEMGLHPLFLMVPATLAASTGFMLPVATAPNTIVFGSRKLAVSDMARAGFLMDLAGIGVIALLVLFLL